MGSFFAGVKAGTPSGVLYIGGLAVFNVLLLLALKADVLQTISQSFPQACTAGPQVNGTATPEGCYSLLLAVDVPYVAFIGFFITIVYMGLFGLLYEWFPGNGPLVKGEIIAAVVGMNLLLFGFYGFSFNEVSALATGVFLLAWTPIFGYFAGRFYKRYTRLVTFEGAGASPARIMVDGRDFTGKSRTFALKSTHELRAEAGDTAFRGWAVSGGVKVEDPRSYETTMEIEGDGVLKLQVGSGKQSNDEELFSPRLRLYTKTESRAGPCEYWRSPKKRTASSRRSTSAPATGGTTSATGAGCCSANATAPSLGHFWITEASARRSLLGA